VPRDVASRNAKEVCDEGRGVGETGLAVYLDFRDAIKQDGQDVILRKYGNLFHMYEKITAQNPSRQPMMIFPAVHYTMGGLWVDYNLMSTVSGLFVLGEANFSDHGANRLGASALMQGLADGYFVLPYTVCDYLAETGYYLHDTNHDAYIVAEEHVVQRVAALMKNRESGKKGLQTVDDFHRRLGKILWDHCGMARNNDGLNKALALIPELRQEFWDRVTVPGSGQELNQSLERAGRVADFMEFSQIMVQDALAREESCGCHLREESQTEEHEALRDDEHFSHVAVWEYKGEGKPAVMHKEPLTFENVTLSQRSYK
jgi:succinate dehydrogenase / fumarate reductase flavoprotein subunit